MENIIVIKPGLEPTIYFRHVCTQCRAILDIKNSILEFKCPGCDNNEICDQSPENMIKKYGEIESSSPRQLTKNSSKKLSKKNL